MQGAIAADQAPLKSPFVENSQRALAYGCGGLNIPGPTGEADDLGYGVVLVLPPNCYQPVTDAGLIDWYKALHAARGTRSIQIHFNKFPQMTGIGIPVEVIAELARHAPDRFAGIKDSSGDLDYCRAIAAANPALSDFQSSEAAIEPAHADGFAGCISASGNMTAPLAAEIWELRAAPPATRCRDLLRQGGAIAGPTLVANVKSLAADRTMNALWRAVLPPFRPLPEAAGQDLKIALKE